MLVRDREKGSMEKFSGIKKRLPKKLIMLGMTAMYSTSKVINTGLLP